MTKGENKHIANVSFITEIKELKKEISFYADENNKLKKRLQ